jgi:hypothetical protein
MSFKHYLGKSNLLWRLIITNKQYLMYKHFIKLYMTWLQKKRKVPTRCVLDVAHNIQGSQSIYLRLRKPLFTWKTFDLIDDFPWFFIMWEIEESFFSFCASCIVSKLENYSRFTRPKYACYTSTKTKWKFSLLAVIK